MTKERLDIDFTYARTALALRQTAAHAFGIPLDREFTWDMLIALICGLPASELPKKIVIRGYPSGRGSLREEQIGLSAVFDELQRRYPDMSIAVILH